MESSHQAQTRDSKLVRSATTETFASKLEIVAVATVIFITAWQVPPNVLDRHILGTAAYVVFPPTTTS